MAEIFYQDAEFGRAINTMTVVGHDLRDAGNMLVNSIGGELGPDGLEAAVKYAAENWRAGAVALGVVAGDIAAKIREEIVEYSGRDSRAEKVFIEAMAGVPIPDRTSLPHLSSQYACSNHEEIPRSTEEATPNG